MFRNTLAVLIFSLLNEHIEGLRRECRNISVDYELLDTEKPLDQALHRYLSVREKRY